MLAANVYSFALVFLAYAAALVSVVSAGTNEEGLQFLAENKQKPGVFTLPSGLQYKVLREGTGAFHPAVDSSCECHYAGTLLDGTTFDSSYDRGQPANFAPNQVIAGWTEAMQLMVQGDKWELYIPSELGYGDRGSPPKIPGGSVLIFTMEILDIMGEPNDLVPAEPKCNVTTRETCSDKDNAYLDKAGTWTDDKTKAEIDRLSNLMKDARHMKPALAQWVRRRLQLLDQLLGKVSAAAADDTTSSSEKPEAEL